MIHGRIRESLRQLVSDYDSSEELIFYISLPQRAIIYKAMIRLKMQYAGRLTKLDSIQNRAKRVIDLPTMKIIVFSCWYSTLFYCMFYKQNHQCLCHLISDIHVHDDPRLWPSVRSNDRAVIVPRSYFVSA